MSPSAWPTSGSPDRRGSPWRCTPWTASGYCTGPGRSPDSCRAGKNSASRSRAPWPGGPPCCSATSQPATWTPPAPGPSSTCSTPSTATASPWSSSPTTPASPPGLAATWPSPTASSPKSSPRGPGPSRRKQDGERIVPAWNKVTARGGTLASGLADIITEASTSVSARPVRSSLTMLGAAIGVAAFAVVTGLTSTTRAQVNGRFTSLAATEVVVSDTQPAPGSLAFPPDTEQLIDRIHGVLSSGVTFQVPVPSTPSIGADLIVATRPGSAAVVASQIPAAILPTDPGRLVVVTSSAPFILQAVINSDISRLLLLAGIIALLIGAAAIASITLTSVLERYYEIGVRRALGATRPAIVAQFLTEATILGACGGLAGTCAAVIALVAVSSANGWYPVLNPLTIIPDPLIGAAVGCAAGAYPPLRAALLDPVEALRR